MKGTKVTTLEQFRSAAKLFDLQFSFQLKLSSGAIENTTTDNREHTFLLGGSSTDSVLEMCAVAKLTELYGVEITNQNFQPGTEEPIMSVFMNSTMPLRDIYMYAIMKKYLSEKQFNKELEDIEFYYNQSQEIDTTTTSLFWTASLFYILRTFKDQQLEIPETLSPIAYVFDYLDEITTLAPTADRLCDMANVFLFKMGVSSYFNAQTQLYSFEYSETFANHF